MSEIHNEARYFRLHIQDMIDCCQKVLSYTEGLDHEAFNADTLVYDATLHNLVLIGEAAVHIPGDTRDAHPEIHWRRFIATRNRLAHGLSGIDADVIWDVIRTEVPRLLPELRNLLNEVNEASG
ncbi:MAG: DUF86 domain-containing protein [Gemmatimonadetes bacterium]|nr:DUF86 domain-containing protein [Gemmatimonadota bacterium]